MKSKLNRILLVLVFALAMNVAMAEQVTIDFPQYQDNTCAQISCNYVGYNSYNMMLSGTTVYLVFPQYTVSNVCYYFGWFC